MSEKAVASPMTPTARAGRKEEPTMTDEQINALAREYADLVKRLFPDTSDHIYRDKIFQAKNVIKLIMRDFCIVEKEKVLELYKKSMNAEQWGDRGDDNLYGGYVLETLFPELFKDEEK